MKKEKWLVLDTNINGILAVSLKEFNEYVDKYTSNKEVNDIILTKSGNISQATLRNLPAAKTWKRDNRMEFHYIDGQTHIRVSYAIAYDEHNADKDIYIAQKALNYFKGIMDVIPTDDIEEDIELFRCPENLNSQYYNYCNESLTNMTIDNCYSLDRNSAFLASMLTVYPQTKPWVDKYYDDKLHPERFGGKDTAEYKSFKQYDKIIVGWLKNARYNRSHAWKKIVSNSNEVVHKLRKTIEDAGHLVLVVNTDAVKFIDYYNYTGSKELGEFKYEWFDTKMYVKSVKSYAYLDNNKWKFKQAGDCKLDEIKPREEWTLEDFKRKETFLKSKITIEGLKLVNNYENI